MKKGLILVCAAVFILVVGTGIVAPLLSPYAETLNATGVQVGLLFSAFYTVRILSGSYIGKLADRKGAKEILRISLILYPFIGLLYAISWNYPILLGARLLHGLASAMMLPMVMTYIGHITPEGQEAKYMGIYNTVTFLANSVGPLVGGLIAGEFGYKIAFSSLLFLSCIALIIVCILPSTQITNSKQVERTEEKTKEYKKKSAWKDGRLISISVINIIDSILSVFIFSFYAIYLSQKGVNIKFISLLITINNVIVGITQIPISKLVDKFDRGNLILTSGFFTILI
ncbi:MFS transporter, partial [Anaerosporobacter sp.]